MIDDILFLCTALLFLTATILLLMRIGVARLESAIGIMGDGLPAGKVVPSWILPDTQDVWQRTPLQEAWQFLIFVDYALASFPSLIADIYTLSQEKELQILILSKRDRESCEAIAREFLLPIPVIPVNEAFYDQFRVRVIPYGFLLDPYGVAHWSGLVSADGIMTHVWQLTRNVQHEMEMIKR